MQSLILSILNFCYFNLGIIFEIINLTRQLKIRKIWFDEYDNAGKGQGYLGRPMGAPYKIKTMNNESAWARKFEGGFVICNPTQYKMNIPLPESYINKRSTSS